MGSESAARAFAIKKNFIDETLNGVKVAVIRFCVSLVIINVVNFIFWSKAEDVSKQRIEDNNFSISFTLFLSSLLYC